MRCNGCQEDLAETKQQSVATSCFHLFCGNCIQKIVESESACPVCESVITKSNIKLVRVLQEPQAFKALQAELQAARLHQKLDKMRAQCNARLQEVHDGYLKAKRKYKEVAEEKNRLTADNQELQQKYSQKAAQTRKLQDMFQKVQQENEVLRSQGNRGGQLQNFLAGSPNHLQPKSGGGGGHVVTTYQRKQLFLGEDAQDVLGQPLLDSGRNDNFQGFFSGNRNGGRMTGPSSQRMFPGVADKGAPGQSPLVSPLMPADSGLTPPSRANHLGHLLGGPSAFGSSQKRHDVFMSGGARRGPAPSGLASL